METEFYTVNLEIYTKYVIFTKIFTKYVREKYLLMLVPMNYLRYNFS